MNPCMVTTGFFVLSRCGRPAATMCAGCGRAVCGEHMVPQGLCQECAVAHGYGGTDPYDPAWTRRYRRWHYQRTSREYRDAGYYSAFDAYDRGAFNPEHAHSTEYESHGGSDFVDS